MKHNNRHYDYSLFIAIVLIPLFWSLSTWARTGRDTEQLKMNINISGTVVATGSCRFDNYSGGLDEVDWGNVTYSTTNGFKLIGEYRQKLDGAMTCTGDTEGITFMNFTDYNGSGIDFNGHKLLKVTGSYGKYLGVQLLVNGVVQDVGTAFNVDMANPPSLEANLIQIGTTPDVPDANNSSILAAAVLTMEFQ